MGETFYLGIFIIVLTMLVGFVRPAKNVLVYVTIIGKLIPKLSIIILEYFFQNLKITKDKLELPSLPDDHCVISRR